jgi:hypothetical protein
VLAGLFATHPAFADGPAFGTMDDMGTLGMSPGVNAPMVRDAIVKALNGRGWDVQTQTDTTVVGYLKHRGYEARLTFVYDAVHIRILSDSYKIDSAGKIEERGIPGRWVKNLKNDIPRFLAAAMAKR